MELEQAEREAHHAAEQQVSEVEHCDVPAV